MLGAYEECCRHAEAGVALYDPEQHRSHAAIYGGHDVKVCALGEWAVSCWLLGRPVEALEHVRSALEWADALSHVGSRVHAMDYALQLHKLRRDAAEVARRAAELVEYASEQQLPEHRAKGALFHGWARACLGDLPGGLSEMRDALTSEQDTGTPEDFPLYYEMFAEVCARAGNVEEGLAAVSEGFAQAARGGLVYWNAELYRRRGELLLLGGNDRVAAGACFEEAIACAQSHGARVLELRAARDLARLSRDEGRLDEAASILRPVYEGFTQGFETLDLVEARRLLEEVT
jgi:predicted ATPase